MKPLEENEEVNGISTQKSTDIPSCIIGIGASAGGLEAIAELLEALPVDTGMAFVIIQHLSPDYKSMLSEILERHTKMPVIQAGSGMEVRKNTVYIIPPKYFLLLENGFFALEEYSEDKKRINHPVDVFFRSLASQEQRKTVVVILSGTGSDGTAGAKIVQENGGVVLVQTPDSAKFNGMPVNAIQAKVADKTLNPSDIAEELTHLSIALHGITQNSSDQELLDTIYTILKNVCNINFMYYKTSTVMRRVQRRMVINHIETLNDYIYYLQSNHSECELLTREMLIGVTGFFRDAHSFDVLKENVIKPLVEQAAAGITPIRVWVPGCSTGEEAYSIAITFYEVMEELGKSATVKIFATDLDAQSIRIASLGEYGESVAENLSAVRLGHFFLRRNGKYIVSKDIRKMIVFAPQNIIQDPPFGNLDLVSCRNMLIYFQSSLQHKVMDLFDMVLKPGGYLFLGAAETVGNKADSFSDYFPGERIYLHKGEKMPPKEHNSGPNTLPFFKRTSVKEKNPVRTLSTPNEQGGMQLTVLEQFLPATFIVDEQNKLIHTFGKCSNYLRIPTGKVEFDIYNILSNDLRIPVSNLIQQTRAEKSTIIYTDVNIHGEVCSETVTLSSNPLQNEDCTGEIKLIAVTISHTCEYKAPETAITYNNDVASSRRIADLENELANTKVKLKGTVSELESVNEELQAANEELLTSNEELQSSNEELQSVNEELYTVNAEYQQKLKEITELNNDVAFFLSSAYIGVLFLDKNLRIRRFTSFISSAFKVVEQDIGRSIQCIAYNFPDTNLVEITKDVMGTSKAKDVDVVSINGKYYFVRVAPFMTQDEQKDGVVITFVDTTNQIVSAHRMNNITDELKSAREANRDKDNFLSRISHDMRSPLYEITGLLELTQHIDGLPEEAVANLKEMLGSANYLLGIINDTVAVGKINAKGITVSKRPVYSDNMLRQVLSTIRFQALNADIYLSEDLSKCDNANVLMDKNHIMQVLVNLLGNAIKYTQAGGKVDFSAESIQIDDSKVKHIYTISDNGKGISEDFQKKMFHAFEQENEASGKQGTGLGLYIVKQLLDAMGGTIECISHENQGTKFIVTMTYEFAPDQAGIEKKEQPCNKQNVLCNTRILVCDDHPINLKIAKKVLTTAGASVETASNGRSAFDLFMRNPAYYYDAILMDIRMPEMDGIQTTRAIRVSQHEDSITIPIIAMTADAFSEDKEKGFAAGLTDYVTKPISMKHLIDTVINVIN